jgi:hypothetical protein
MVKKSKKVISFPLDLGKLPEKYFFRNQEDLLDSKFIDDNSLFVYHIIAKGLFSSDKSRKWDAGVIFLYLHPFEWKSIDFISFLFAVSKKYKLVVEDIGTYRGAVEDDAEVSYEPREYEGGYKWFLELEEKEPDREEVVLADRLLEEKASIEDVERALIYADRFAPMYRDEKSELYLSKDLFRSILNYTHFSFSVNSVQRSTVKNNVDAYLEAFINGKLLRNNKSKWVGDTSVSQSKNIFTFKKHSTLFREYLQKMHDDFGNAVVIENTFEDGFPNMSYPDAEFIKTRYENRSFLFIHTLLAFEKQGFLKIKWLGSNWDMNENKKLAFQIGIEFLPAFFNEDLSKKLSFDENRARFYVQGKEIRLRKFGNEYHTLRIMFEKPEEISRDWFFSEIAERIDEANINDKKYYNAIYQVGTKLEKQGIKEFFITTRQSVKINDKYLS